MIGWNIGDIAVCIDDTMPENVSPAQLEIARREMRAGRHYLVSAVKCTADGLGLHFCGIQSPRSAGFREDRFLKVEPIEPIHIEQKDLIHGIA